MIDLTQHYNNIIQGNSYQILKQFPDKSVNCLITSPPYFQARKYHIESTNISGWKGELGWEETPDLFVQHLCDLFDEMKRVLTDDGTMWINLGDGYSGGSAMSMSERLSKESDNTKAKLFDKKNAKSTVKFQPKSLLGIPFRFAIEMLNRGWTLRNTIIWCLSSETKMFVLVEDEYKLCTLTDIYINFFNNKKIFLPTLNKGESEWVELINIFNSDKKSGYKITLTNGLNVTATEDHIFPVSRTSIHKKNISYIKLDFKKVSELTNKDYLYINTKFNIEEKKYNYTYNDGLAVGIFIAEGSYIKRRKKKYKKNKISEGILKYHAQKNGYLSVDDYLKNRHNKIGVQLSHYDKKFIDKLNFDIKSFDNNTAHHSRDKKYLNLLEKFVMGDNAYTKHLNNNVWNTNKEFLKGILDGYLQGDGSYDKENDRWLIGFISKNDYLMDDLMLICKILEYDFRRHSLREIAQTGQLRTNYSKRNKYKNLIKQKIRSIEKINDCSFFDLTVKPIYGTYCGKSKHVIGGTKDKKVDKWNDLFCIGNGILTHNCKPNAQPSSVKDRFTVDYEYIFFFVKQQKYYFEQQFESLKESTKQRAKYNWCRDDTKAASYRELSGLNQNILFAGALNPKGRNKRCIWTLATAQCKEAHFAVYPERLVEQMILPGCPEGGIVLDPFAGTGTTIRVAERLKRIGIGIELSKEYIKIFDDKIHEQRFEDKSYLGKLSDYY